MLRYSTNLTAEVVGMAASAADGATPASLADSAGEMNIWLGRRSAGGGRGWSTIRACRGCRASGPRTWSARWCGPGRQAPLASLLRPFPVEEAAVPLSVSAKTGTLNFVCALTGYLTTATGRELAFAILTSDLERRATLTEAERDSPPGGKAWAGRSRALQRRLLAGWAVTHA